MSMHKIKIWFYWFFVWPAILCYYLTPQKQQENLKMDMKRIAGNRVDKHFLWTLYNLFIAGNEFRDIYYMRIGRFSKLFRWYLPGQTLCGISMKRENIGGGLYIQHGWSMVLQAEKVGKNLWINQNVTVGFRGNGQPIIGDNVRIGAGAIILGDITIGNNVNIGAGAVVVKDVPDNCTIVSPPAFICKRDGVKVHEEL